MTSRHRLQFLLLYSGTMVVRVRNIALQAISRSEPLLSKLNLFSWYSRTSVIRPSVLAPSRIQSLALFIDPAAAKYIRH